MWEGAVAWESCLPCEADEDWACGAIIVFWLVEEGLDVLADGREISLGAHSCVCVVLVWLNLYPKHDVSKLSRWWTPVKRKYTDYSLEKESGERYISGENSGKTGLNYKPISIAAFTILSVVLHIGPRHSEYIWTLNHYATRSHWPPTTFYRDVVELDDDFVV